MSAAENLIDHIYNSQADAHRYFITAKGTSAAVQYLNLKEAERSGRRAEKIALFAIAVTAIVGIIQITASITPPPENWNQQLFLLIFILLSVGAVLYSIAKWLNS